jgi:hypothetical protein
MTRNTVHGPNTGIGRRKARMAGLAAAAVLLVAACAPQNTAKDPEPAQGAAGENPFAHVHGLAVDPDSQELLLATHNGLFTIDDAGSITSVGPTMDLMGFAVAGPDRYYASGHPGPDGELPNPLGLIESTDGGETWQELSRQGESDFHTMTVSGKGVVGFDGMLRLTADGEKWSEASDQLQPANLAATIDGAVVLATTEEGVQRSADGGRTWTLPANAPVLLMTAFADAKTAVGVTPAGEAYISRDAGETWEKAGGSTARPSAVAASADGEGGVKIWVATENGIESSDDGGTSFSTTVRAGAQ